MRISTLYVENFKNLAKQSVNFADDMAINILLGQNGQGKTNFLEAIRFLALPKPLRSRSLSHCVMQNENFMRIGGEIIDAKANKLEFGYQMAPLRRMYKINEGEVEAKHFIGNLHVVLFTPDDLNLLTGAPNLRRRFIDSILIQLYPEYFEAFSHYHGILKQRNSLLKQLRDKPNLKAGLSVWDKQLLAAMITVINLRVHFTQACRNKLTETYQDLAESNDKLDFDYDWHEPVTETVLAQKLQAAYKDDVRYGHTTFGPHRDDFEILINQQKASICASRGELRTVVLALKLIELAYFKESANTSPILLLDDVFSELDQSRREKLLKLSANHQTFITTVEQKYFHETEYPFHVYSVDTGIMTQSVL
ncbi:hypothetical protein COV81_01045 [Candidatus Peregrinibacteria bacterium CG11_big_fil_rev_8_21_14_0_20_41_10]|nr:MAG: hypothetical protein COV81_01045 [Candidatus Peregrinibacteria bacterium CG11_big_fil_rev_8_21_14_0_20_41_10]PJC38129.1 MAG: hypothetical protein CO045_01980 [Candidatus Peregrinibacteria bacterium CG_4_9_14_0_2_um_filter_41_14]